MTPSRITTLLGLAASIAVAPTALAQAPPSLQDAQRHFQNEEWELADQHTRDMLIWLGGPETRKRNFVYSLFLGVLA